MKKVIFKSLFTSILLVLGLSVGVKQTTHEVVEAAEGDLLAEFNSDTLVTGSGYAEYSDDNWILTMGGNNKSIGVNSKNKAKAKLGSYVNVAAGLYTESETVISAVIAKKPLSKVTKVNISSTNVTKDETTVTLTKSLDNSTYEIVEQKNMSTSVTETLFELPFSNENYYYSIIFHNANDFRLDECLISFFEGTDLSVSYTATLHYNDGTTPDGSITSVDGKFPTPETPTRTGYVFDGWYTDATFENLFDFENTFATENIHLYAKWVDERDTYLQTTSFALGFDYVVSGGNKLSSMDQLKSGETYYIFTEYNQNIIVANNELNGKRLSYEIDPTFTLAAEFKIEKVNETQYTIMNISNNQYVTKAIGYSESEVLWDISYDQELNRFVLPTEATKQMLYNDGYGFGSYANSNVGDFGSVYLASTASYSFSNYALRFGTEITTENYAKLGEVVSYGVLVAPTANLGDVTFKDLCSTAAELSTLIELTEALNITNAKMQTTETGYSFGGLLQNIPETQIHTSVSAACYVVNAAGEVFFAEQKDMSIVGAATYYAEHAAELGLNETETTLVNVLKGM